MKRISIFLLIAFIMGCNASNTSNLADSKKTKDPIATAASAKAAIFKKYSEEEVRKYLREDYIQHNPNVATGVNPIVDLLPDLRDSGISYKTHRVFQDGNFVVMHNSFDNAEILGAKEVVTFDIWRIENGKVAEHWDAINPVVNETASGRSQIDGPTKVKDLDKTEENKALVKKLVEEVFIGGNPTNITNYISTTQYDQHNPLVKDGLSGLNEAITYLSSQNNMFKYYKVHNLLGSGNFVLVQAEGEWNNKPYFFYDLFRVDQGKVVEHWDIVGEIPEKMAHNNGLF